MRNKKIRLVAISGLMLLGLLLCAQPLFAVTLDLQVGATADDANEEGPGTVDTSDDQLKIYSYTPATDSDYRYGGMRWQNVTIPQGATITAAYISLYSNGGSNEDNMNVDIHFEVAENPVAFSSSNKISTRTTSMSIESVAWVAELPATNWYNSPSLVDVVQEIVDGTDWDSGDAMVALFVPKISGTVLKYRCASYDDPDPSHTYAPKLHIEYTPAWMATGSFTGNGTSQSISGLGFQPDVVWIKADNATYPGAISTSSMGSDQTKNASGTGALHSGSVTSLDSDGFSVGSGTDVNASDVTYYWTAFDANSDMVVSSYTGNGSATQAISGVGFSPDYVIILGDNSTYAYNRTTYGGLYARRMRNSGASTDAIISLDADGFTAGDGSDDSGGNMNASSVDYHYIAFNEAAGKIDVGSYLGGTPSDDRNITGVGFQPEFVVIQDYLSTQDLVFKSDQMSGDSALTNRGALNTNIIQDLISDGFQVGGANSVNEDGKNYAHVAFNITDGGGGGATTTLGDGSDPANDTVAPGSTDQIVDRFTFVASSGSDSVATLVVTTANTDAIASVEIWNNAETTQYFTTDSTPNGNLWEFSGGTEIPVSDTEATFVVRFTAKGHASLPNPIEYAVTGTVTDHTCTNSKAGTDTGSATITVDNDPPDNATWGTITPGDGQIELNWTNPGSDFYRVLIIRNTATPITDTPDEGTEYSVPGTIGSSTIVYVGSGQTYTDSGVSNGTAYYYMIFAYDAYINYASGAQTGPHTPTAAGATTTLGDGSDPANDTVAPGSTNQIVDKFTFVASSGSDSVATLVVTTANTDAIASVEIWNNTETTQYFSTDSTPNGNLWEFSGGTAIPVSDTEATFVVRFTAKDHATLPNPIEYAVTGTVTDYTCTNSKAGTDTDSATITVDNDPPDNATWGTITPGNTQIELNWTNPVADFNKVVILRRAGSAVGDAPTDGTEYNVNDPIGTSIVRYVGSLETFTDTGLTNDTDYYYKIFAYDTYINYASGAATGPHTPTAPTTTHYRSVGTTATALESGTSNALTISGSTATFGTGLSNNIGVGDAIQYDSDDDDIIDAIAFIHGRTSSTEYTVKDKDGGTPTAVTGDNDWEIYRAYTKLSNWENQIENPNITEPTEDDVNPSTDLVTANTIMMVACYGDGEDTASALIDSWTTGPDNYIKIYTPTSLSEVGTSQRHNGAWDTSAYRISMDGTYFAPIGIRERYVRIDGLQIDSNVEYSGESNGIHVSDGEDPNDAAVEVHISNCIIRMTVASPSTTAFGIGALNQFGGANSLYVAKVWNNIIYGYTAAGGTKGTCMYAQNNGTVYAYNNTCVGGSGAPIGIAGYDSVDFYAKNNIAIDCTNPYNGTFHANSTNNISDTGDAPGSNPVSGEPTFVNKAGNNYHLDSSDTVAQGAGADLDGDSNLPITDDIDGDARDSTQPDIGADEYIGAPVTINYRSIGTNTGTVYGTGTASICSGDTTVNFSSGASLPVPTAVGAVGLGDKLTIGSEEFYILSRDSATQVTVQSAATADHETEGYTIQRAYTDIQTWENAHDGLLVSENRREIGVCYKDGAFALTTGVTFDDSTTDSDHYMHLTVAEGQRHNGRAGTGVVIDGGGFAASAGNVFHVRDTYFRMEWLEIRNYEGGTNAVPIANGQPINLSEGNAGNNLLSHLIIHDYTSTGRGALNTYEDFTVRNCIIYDGDVGLRAYGDDLNQDVTIENCTVWGMTGDGIYIRDGTVVIKNTISVGCTADDFDIDVSDSGIAITYFGYNMYSDVDGFTPGDYQGYNQSPPGTLEDLFYSLGSGTEDLHIHSSGHNALNNGVSLVGSFTDDIDGDTRPQGASWDIGADEHTTPATGIYVDGTLGNDGNAGTWDAPYATVTQAESVASAGDTIYIRGGITYDENELVVNVSGSSGNEITFTKWPGPESNPVISADLGACRLTSFRV